MSDKPARRSARLLALAAANDLENLPETRQQGAEAPATIGKFELLSVAGRKERVKAAPSPSLAEPVLPYSRWTSIGYDHRVATGMVALQNSLNALICKLGNDGRGGRWTGIRGHSLKITPISRMSASDLGFALPHNGLLYPHWRAFSTSLKNYDGYHPIFISFVSVRLENAVMGILRPALAAPKLTSLYFSCNELQRGGLAILAGVIEQAEALESFAVCRNRIGDQDEEVVARLAAAIRNHPSLQRLTLSSCGIGDGKSGKVMLSCIRNNALKSVDLRRNGIACDDAHFIAKMLAKAKNHCVTEVSLEDNRLGDKGAALFASALRLNRTLTCLNLRKNNIGRKGTEMLLKALFDTSSLNAISNSNHSCLVKLQDEEGASGDDDPGELVESMNNPRVLDYSSRTPKLRSAMFAGLARASRGLSNLQYFKDIPAELIPRVFAMAQSETGRCERTRAHALTFELLRAMPCIFVAGNRPDAVIGGKRKRCHLA